MNQRILWIFACLSLLTLTTCGKDGPTEPELPEPPPAPVPTRIVVSPPSVTLDAIGQTVQLTAQVFDQNSAPMSSAVVALDQRRRRRCDGRRRETGDGGQ